MIQKTKLFNEGVGSVSYRACSRRSPARSTVATVTLMLAARHPARKRCVADHSVTSVIEHVFLVCYMCIFLLQSLVARCKAPCPTVHARAMSL